MADTITFGCKKQKNGCRKDTTDTAIAEGCYLNANRTGCTADRKLAWVVSSPAAPAPVEEESEPSAAPEPVEEESEPSAAVAEPEPPSRASPAYAEYARGLQERRKRAQAEYEAAAAEEARQAEEYGMETEERSGRTVEEQEALDALQRQTETCNSEEAALKARLAQITAVKEARKKQLDDLTQHVVTMTELARQKAYLDQKKEDRERLRVQGIATQASEHERIMAAKFLLAQELAKCEEQLNALRSNIALEENALDEINAAIAAQNAQAGL